MYIVSEGLGKSEKKKIKKIIVPTLLRYLCPAIPQDLEKSSPDSDADADHSPCCPRPHGPYPGALEH